MKHNLTDEGVSSTFLGFDIGGTSTRCVVVTNHGAALGYGAATGGNPISVGRSAFSRSVRTAAAMALATSGRRVEGISGVNFALAGGPEQSEAPPDILEALRPLGLSCPVTLSSDALAAFASGTPAPEGYLLLSGTGAAALHVADGTCQTTVDGNGWLFGDHGSGFWFGRQVLMATADHLMGRGDSTSLTQTLLDSAGLVADMNRMAGRPAVLNALITHVYALPPIRVAEWAPLAFRDPQDQVSQRIVERGARHLARTLNAAINEPWQGPLVLAGSVLFHQPRLQEAILRHCNVPKGTAVTSVPDGVVGSAMQAIRAFSHSPTEAEFSRLSQSIAALRSLSPKNR